MPQVLAEGGEGSRAGAEHAVAVQRPAHHLQEGEEDAALHAGRMCALVDGLVAVVWRPLVEHCQMDFFSQELNNNGLLRHIKSIWNDLYSRISKK